MQFCLVITPLGTNKSSSCLANIYISVNYNIPHHLCPNLAIMFGSFSPISNGPLYLLSIFPHWGLWTFIISESFSPLIISPVSQGSKAYRITLSTCSPRFLYGCWSLSSLFSLNSFLTLGQFQHHWTGIPVSFGKTGCQMGKRPISVPTGREAIAWDHFLLNIRESTEEMNRRKYSLEFAFLRYQRIQPWNPNP